MARCLPAESVSRCATRRSHAMLVPGNPNAALSFRLLCVALVALLFGPPCLKESFSPPMKKLFVSVP